MYQKKFLNQTFLGLLVGFCALLLVFDNYWINYLPLIFAFGFVTFGFLAFTTFTNFSIHLKRLQPELFKKFVFNVGVWKGQGVDIQALFYEKGAFNKMQRELRESLIYIRRAILYLLLSFLAMPISAIIMMCL